MSAPLTHHGSNRYLDPYTKLWTTKILPGEYAVVPMGEVVVTAVGSCIAACIHDRVLGIGGMNHFMLPTSVGGDWAGQSSAARYGNYAMEYLINEILKQGGKRTQLEAKIFGGGVMMASQIAVGDMNIDFAKAYLQTEGIPLKAVDVGGAYSRKVYFTPQTGEVSLKKLSVQNNATLSDREASYAKNLKIGSLSGEVELF